MKNSEDLRPNSKTQEENQNLCHYCHRQGHKAFNCRFKKRKEKAKEEKQRRQKEKTEDNFKKFIALQISKVVKIIKQFSANSSVSPIYEEICLAEESIPQPKYVPKNVQHHASHEKSKHLETAHKSASQPEQASSPVRAHLNEAPSQARPQQNQVPSQAPHHHHEINTEGDGGGGDEVVSYRSPLPSSPDVKPTQRSKLQNQPQNNKRSEAQPHEQKEKPAPYKTSPPEMMPIQTQRKQQPIPQQQTQYKEFARPAQQEQQTVENLAKQKRFAPNNVKQAQSHQETAPRPNHIHKEAQPQPDVNPILVLKQHQQMKPELQLQQTSSPEMISFPAHQACQSQINQHLAPSARPRQDTQPHSFQDHQHMMTIHAQQPKKCLKCPEVQQHSEQNEEFAPTSSPKMKSILHSQLDQLSTPHYARPQDLTHHPHEHPQTCSKKQAQHQHPTQHSNQHQQQARLQELIQNKQHAQPEKSALQPITAQDQRPEQQIQRHQAPASQPQDVAQPHHEPTPSTSQAPLKNKKEANQRPRPIQQSQSNQHSAPNAQPKMKSQPHQTQQPKQQSKQIQKKEDKTCKNEYLLVELNIFESKKQQNEVAIISEINQTILFVDAKLSRIEYETKLQMKTIKKFKKHYKRNGTRNFLIHKNILT